MKYTYQNEDMDALRLTFEEMLHEIEFLKAALDNADEAVIELYEEANDLEARLNRLREEYDQDMFDAAEDYVELERSYNILAEQYVDLHDWLMDDDFVGIICGK